MQTTLFVLLCIYLFWTLINNVSLLVNSVNFLTKYWYQNFFSQHVGKKNLIVRMLLISFFLLQEKPKQRNYLYSTLQLKMPLISATYINMHTYACTFTFFPPRLSSSDVLQQNITQSRGRGTVRLKDTTKLPVKALPLIFE